MDGADAARMAGAPGLEEVERLGTAHLANGDAVGPEAERAADEIADRTRCPDFDRFKPLFDQVQRDLDAGTRATRPW